MKAKLIAMSFGALIPMASWSASLNCERTNVDGSSVQVSIPRNSVIRSGNFSVAKDNYLRTQFGQTSKASALKVAVSFGDFDWSNKAPNDPLFVSPDYNLKRAERHLPSIMIQDYQVPVMPATQTVVICKNVELASNEKIVFKFTYHERSEMPWVDYASFEAVENGIASEPAFLGSTPQAAMRGSRHIKGELSKYFGSAKVLDLVWTITDGQEASDRSITDPALEAYPGLNRYVVTGLNEITPLPWPTLNNIKQLNYDSRWVSPVLRILK